MLSSYDFALTDRNDNCMRAVIVKACRSFDGPVSQTRLGDAYYEALRCCLTGDRNIDSNTGWSASAMSLSFSQAHACFTDCLFAKLLGS